MKYLIILLISLLTQVGFCQTTEAEKVFWDIVHPNMEEGIEIGFTGTVHPGMFFYHLKAFRADTSNSYPANIAFPSEVITLSEKERAFLIKESERAIGRQWNLEYDKGLIKVAHDNTIAFLKQDINRKLMIISQPIFFRDSALCLIFYSQLCCGGVYGFAELAFYRKEDNKWTKWMSVSEGAF